MISSRMLLISSLILAMCVAFPSGDFRERRQIVFPTEAGGMAPAYSCVTPNREQGQCIVVSRCLSLCWMNSNQLNEYQCGMQKQELKVCCPENGEGIEPCVTPDREQGQCVLFTRCSSLRTVNYNRLRSYNCGFQGDEPKVCCPSNNTGGVTNSPARTAPPTRGTPVVERPSFLPRDCGISLTTKLRIVGGKESVPGAWPWMAAVYQRKRGFKTTECGGSLVASNYVITAAHCVLNYMGQTRRAKFLSVRLGEHNLYDDNDGMSPIEIPVESLKRHGEYNDRTRENDIAILKLARHVTFRKDIAPICLPYDSLVNEDLTSRRAFVCGWGDLAFGGLLSSVLREVSLRVIDQEVCRRAYQCLLPIKDIYICAGSLNGTGDACAGDSGGPLMLVGKEYRFYMMGIVSFGKDCARTGFPGIYTRVTKYLDWIKMNMS